MVDREMMKKTTGSIRMTANLPTDDRWTEGVAMAATARAHGAKGEADCNPPPTLTSSVADSEDSGLAVSFCTG